MSNDELQNLEKAGRFRKQVDKNKEKVMDMLKMNGPEYLPIQAGKAGLVIDEPSLKRRKLEIEDLAEKAQIIKQARETQYQLSMGRALLERKQGEFFEKQAAPLSKVIKDSAEENKKQLDAINANLELNGFSEEKIQALQESLASIVEAVDNADDRASAEDLIREVAIKLSKIPPYKDDATLLYKAMFVGLMGMGVETEIEEPPLSKGDSSGSVELAKPPITRGSSAPKPPSEPKPEKMRPKLPEETKGAVEAKAEAVEEGYFNDIPEFIEDYKKWLTIGKAKKGLDKRLVDERKLENQVNDFLNEMGKKHGFTAQITPKIQKFFLNEIQLLRKTGKEIPARLGKIGGKGIKVKGLSGRGWNEAYQQYASSNKTIDDISRLRDNLRKSLYGRGNDITRQIHKDFLAKNYTIGKGMNYSKMKPQQLMKNLTLNIASMKAGNTGVKDQINAIIDQMLDRGIINKAEHRKIWYEYCD